MALPRVTGFLLAALLVVSCSAPPGGGVTPSTPTTTVTEGVIPQALLTRPYPTIPPTAQEAALVEQVVDGDTIKVLTASGTVTVRLIGVDTPETAAPGKPVECRGPEATAFLKALLEGKKVRLSGDPTQDALDKYGRTLAYVWLESGVLANEVLIAGGYGREYTYDKAYEYQAGFRQAETIAKESSVGLWLPGACPSISPSPVESTGASSAPTPAPSTADNGTTPQPSASTTTATTNIPSAGETTVPDGPEDCGPDQIWVKPYTRQDGTYVRGYCRRKPS